jgi:menaquinone-dependent protoporphyrinogen oxidase
MPMTIEFTGFDRPARLASATHSSTMDTVGALAFEPTFDGTRMRWSWEVQPRGVLRLMLPVVSLFGRRQERTIWGNLKRLLESEMQPGVEIKAGAMTVTRSRPQPGASSPALSRTEAADHPAVAGPSKVLVVYASEHGSTKGVAERIGARLVDRRARVEVRPADEIDDVEAYDAVILGSGVYSQRWLPTAREFLRRNAETLAARQVWLFSVGSFGDTHRAIGRLMKREPMDIGEIQEAVRPRDYRVFAGAIERHQWRLVSRLFFHAFGGRFGDNRDWPEIDAWAESIARRLSASDG